jgi:hypothetical protein
VGSKPGSSRFHFFSHFHHLTAEPQRLPTLRLHFSLKTDLKIKYFLLETGLMKSMALRAFPMLSSKWNKVVGLDLQLHRVKKNGK